jgi:hypothetical protein
LGDSASFVDAGAEASVGFIFVEEQSPAKTMVDTKAVATKAKKWLGLFEQIYPDG